MLGTRSLQGDIFDVGNVYALRLPERSFYCQLANAAPKLFSDTEFSSLYSSTRGRPSVPPSLLALMLLLQWYSDGSDMEAVVPARGSLCVAVQNAAPKALVSGAFHHLPARGLANLEHSLDADVLVCSDHQSATKATIELVDRIPGCRGIDAGSLSQAAAIEAFTAVLIGVNIRTRSHASIRLTGLRTETE